MDTFHGGIPSGEVRTWRTVTAIIGTRSKVKLDDIAQLQHKLDEAEEDLETERAERAAELARARAEHNAHIDELQAATTASSAATRAASMRCSSNSPNATGNSTSSTGWSSRCVPTSAGSRVQSSTTAGSCPSDRANWTEKGDLPMEPLQPAKYGKVVGRLMAIVGDGPDEDEYPVAGGFPDARPLAGR
ncbi:hypothetical protein [Rhodococcus ruber]|uniref:hypothetical protein n=1 Tax=Rhodococcus ruber TaxID=1830 RepID=UPI003D819421